MPTFGGAGQQGDTGGAGPPGPDTFTFSGGTHVVGAKGDKVRRSYPHWGGGGSYGYINIQSSGLSFSDGSSV